MIDNSPVRTLVHKGLTIEGYSRAAVQTYWRIPELKVGFDLGAQPWSFMGTGTWFVSHTHLDHVAALPVYVARRRMMKMEPPTIYLPEYAIESVVKMLKYFTRLDRGRMPCELKPIAAGRRDRTVAGAGRHRSRRRGTRFLRSASSCGSGGESCGPNSTICPATRFAICGLRGTEVTEEHRLPLVAYLGDSAPQGLGRLPGDVSGAGVDHGDDVRRSVASQGPDP